MTKACSSRFSRRQTIEGALKEADKMLTGVFADLEPGARNLHGSVVTLQREAAAADETCGAASGVLSDVRARLDATANASATFQRSIAEVAESATGAADLAREATQQGVEAREAVDMLTENGKKIGSVVNLISEIAATGSRHGPRRSRRGVVGPARFRAQGGEANLTLVNHGNRMQLRHRSIGLALD